MGRRRARVVRDGARNGDVGRNDRNGVAVRGGDGRPYGSVVERRAAETVQQTETASPVRDEGQAQSETPKPTQTEEPSPMTETVQQTEPTTETAQGAASAPDEPEDGASTDEQRTFSIGKKSFMIPVKYSELEKDGWKLDLMADETALDGERVWILMANGKNEVETSSVEAYEKGKSLSKYSIGSVEFAEDSGVKPYGWPGVKIGMKVSEAGKKLDAAGFEKTKDEFGTYWECWTDDALIEWSSEDGKTITGYGLSMY